MERDLAEDIVVDAVFYDEQHVGVKVHIIEIDEDQMVTVNYTQNVYSMRGWEEENFDSDTFPMHIVKRKVIDGEWGIDRVPMSRERRGDDT